MLFYIFYVLNLAGFSAVGVFMGNYFMKYADATELDLGIIFMIFPCVIFARPFLSSLADRYQCHKKLLAWFLLATFLSYVPYLLLPFLLEKPEFDSYWWLQPRTRYWILIVCHIAGSFSLSFVRSLGDATTVNYAKRVNSDYTVYRKFGAISFGANGLLIGQFNQGWLLPDFVPAMVVFEASMFILMVLVYLWPDEYFVMVSEQQTIDTGPNSAGEHDLGLPNGRQIIAHMRRKLCQTICFCWPAESNKSTAITREASQIDGIDFSANQANGENQINLSQEKRFLSTRQQIRIFLLLLKRDPRISALFLLLFYSGAIGYAPMFFVYTYLDKYCHATNTCEAASLSGLVMICACTCETACYMLIYAFRKHLNFVFMLQVSFISVAVHYFFYGFVLEHVSPYFFIIESLHGIEYAFVWATTIEMAFRFASQVELLIPELVSLGVISKRDDHELVKVSLMATMNACLTMAFDGAGPIVGSLMLGLVVDRYSFNTAWKVIGTLSLCGFVVVLFVALIAKYLRIGTRTIAQSAIDANNSTGHQGTPETPHLQVGHKIKA